MHLLKVVYHLNTMTHISRKYFLFQSKSKNPNSRNVKTTELFGTTFASQKNISDFAYVCRTAVSPTRSRWGSRSSLQSRTACVPPRRWSELCCVLWRSPPLDWRERVSRDRRRYPKSRLQDKITRAEGSESREWIGAPLTGQVCMRVCVCVCVFITDGHI